MAVMRAVLPLAVAETAVDPDRAFLVLALHVEGELEHVVEQPTIAEAGLAGLSEPGFDGGGQIGIGRLDRQRADDVIGQERRVRSGAAVARIRPDRRPADIVAEPGIGVEALERRRGADIVIQADAVFAADHLAVERSRAELAPAAEAAQRAVLVEDLSCQDAGCDQAVARDIAEVHVTHEDRAEIGGAGRICANDPRAAQIGARIAVADALVFEIFDADHEVAVAASEVRPERSVEQILLCVAARRNAGARAERDAFQILLEQQIDDAGNRARTPGGRCAAGHDLDALDQPSRHEVQVAITDEAPAIEKGERAIGAEAAQIDWRGARRRVAARNGGRDSGAKLRLVV
jgi:hypothetical protein